MRTKDISSYQRERRTKQRKIDSLWHRIDKLVMKGEKFREDSKTRKRFLEQAEKFREQIRRIGGERQ